MFSIQYLIFLILILFVTSGISLILRIRINFIIPSSDPPQKVLAIYAKLIKLKV